MAEIKWTAEAEKWLHDIYDYIAQDNSGAALGVVSGIYQKAHNNELLKINRGVCFEEVASKNLSQVQVITAQEGIPSKMR